MILIIGLGNPGKKFQKTRHNLGFQAIDKIAANFQFPCPHCYAKRCRRAIFNFQSIFNAKISKGEIANKKVILVKPQTFMNESGKSVKKIVLSFKFQVSRLWVVHDDIDLPLGKIKISIGKSSAGHKGVQSIIRELKTKDFVRFRIGIKQRTENKEQRTEVEKFVLKKITKEEEKIVKDVIKKTVGAIEFALKNGIEKAMTKYNK